MAEQHSKRIREYNNNWTVENYPFPICKLVQLGGREREKLFVRFEDLYISENNWMHNLKIKKNLEVTLEM